MRVGSLFSGGGGGDLGFANAGHEIVDIANTNRYRICGNGIVANVTEWIAHRLPKEQAA